MAGLKPSILYEQIRRIIHERLSGYRFEPSPDVQRELNHVWDFAVQTINSR